MIDPKQIYTNLTEVAQEALFTAVITGEATMKVSFNAETEEIHFEILSDIHGCECHDQGEGNNKSGA